MKAFRVTFTIRDATPSDVPQLLDLRNWSIENLDGIWIEQTATLAEHHAWFQERKNNNFPVLVACDEAEKIVGFGSYGTYRGRDGYDLTVEHSVYLYPHAQGHGLGRTLLEKLIEIARARSKHVMLAIIDHQNEVSIRLHEKLGFVEAGRVPEAGKKGGIWHTQVTLYLKLDNRAAPCA